MIRGFTLTNLASEIVMGIVFTVLAILLRILGLKKKTRHYLVPIAMTIGYISFTEYLASYDHLAHAGPKAVTVCTAAWTIGIGVLLQHYWLRFFLVLTLCTIY
jgi:hypothetical protein